MRHKLYLSIGAYYPQMLAKEYKVLRGVCSKYSVVRRREASERMKVRGIATIRIIIGVENSPMILLAMFQKCQVHVELLYPGAPKCCDGSVKSDLLQDKSQ